ncbi:hypothetical protein PsorP6_000440 [Peronosclerospora sorghi]|uniref:Uncharacterized protein n=1 Tax=Peronosclerospora sorghi TaxID=230839 RepID=A0ACC0WX30_9STRA|nr:hypothetical protein PsorP6_000440 [Peronosclerospora sorghi]
MRKHKLYLNLKKCTFGAPEIPVLGCFVGKNGVRPDPEKIRVIVEWPKPNNVKELRKFLGLATYLHKYSCNYAGLIRPLSQLLKKDVEWHWDTQCQDAFDAVKQSLTEAPVLAIADNELPFHVVCDAIDFSIGCTLMQRDHDDRDRVQSRQLRPAERNYPVYDKELLAMKYALAKFRIYLLGDRPFVVYTDHASLRTAVNHHTFLKEWLDGFHSLLSTTLRLNTNPETDALSRRPDYGTTPSVTEGASANAIRCTALSSSIIRQVREAYKTDEETLINQVRSAKNSQSSSALACIDIDCTMVCCFTAQTKNMKVASSFQTTMISNIKLCLSIMMHQFRGIKVERRHTLLSHVTFTSETSTSGYGNTYACEICQRVKPAQSAQVPLQSLPVPTECWKSISMDFVFGLPPDNSRKTGIVVFVDRLSKMVHLTAVLANVTAAQTARIFVDTVFRLHGMPEDIVSDRDPRFAGRFWQETFSLLGTQLKMSTADHPETDGQTERVNRVLGDMLRSYAHAFEQWSDYLPLTEFAITNSVHASTKHTPFYVNALRHPRTPALLGGTPNLSGGGTRSNFERVNAQVATATCEQNDGPSTESTIEAEAASIETEAAYDEYVSAAMDGDNEDNAPTADKAVDEFVLQRQAVIRYIKDALASAFDKQKKNADKQRRKKNKNSFLKGELVLFLPTHALSNFPTRKLLPKYIGPFKVQEIRGNAYTLDIPIAMRLHPTFYVGRLKPYHSSSSYDETQNHGRYRDSPSLPRETCNRLPAVDEHSGESLPPSTAQDQP